MNEVKSTLGLSLHTSFNPAWIYHLCWKGIKQIHQNSQNIALPLVSLIANFKENADVIYGRHAFEIHRAHFICQQKKTHLGSLLPLLPHLLPNSPFYLCKCSLLILCHGTFPLSCIWASSHLCEHFLIEWRCHLYSPRRSWCGLKT